MRMYCPLSEATRHIRLYLEVMLSASLVYPLLMFIKYRYRSLKIAGGRYFNLKWFSGSTEESKKLICTPNNIELYIFLNARRYLMHVISFRGMRGSR